MDKDINFAEMAVLNLLFNTPSLASKVEELKYFMFSSEPHGYIYEELLSITKSGFTPEYNLIITRLTKQSKLDECGGEVYLNYLFNQVNTDVNNFFEYVKFIVDRYKTREVSKAVAFAKNQIDLEIPIDDIILSLSTKLESVPTVVDENVVSIRRANIEMWDELSQKINDVDKIKFSSGFENIDLSTVGFCPGDLWIVAGRPGMGKSSWMCNSVMTGIPSLLFSLEMPRNMIANRIISMDSGIPIFNLRLGTLKEKEMETIQESINRVNELPIFVDTTYLIDIDYVVSTIRKYHREHGVKIVHLDYIQLLVERSQNATHDIGRVSRILKLLAKDLGITVIVYSQLNRLLEGREDKRPLLSDLRQSGNLEEDADLVAMLYRPVIYNKDAKDKDVMEFIIRKQRNGPTGFLYMDFDSCTNRITSRG